MEGDSESLQITQTIVADPQTITLKERNVMEMKVKCNIDSATVDRKDIAAEAVISFLLSFALFSLDRKAVESRVLLLNLGPAFKQLEKKKTCLMRRVYPNFLTLCATIHHSAIC